MKKINVVITVLLTLAAFNSSAGLIVDTGSNESGSSWSFADSQYFAGLFELDQDYTITGLETFLNVWNEGSVAVALHSVDGNTPGSVLYNDFFTVSADSGFGWYGLSSLSWDLSAGSYWVSFTPDTFIGSNPGGAPNPLSEYAQGNVSGGWQDRGVDFFDYLDIGYRVYATTEIPEPSTLAILGLGFIGLTFRHKKNN